MKTILLCSDLDRTLIPNGAEDESPQARPLFAGLAAHPQLRLAYVSGRDKNLVKKGIVDFDLPSPILSSAMWAPPSTVWTGTNGT